MINRYYYTMKDLGVQKTDLRDIFNDDTYQDTIVGKLVDLIFLKYKNSWIEYVDVSADPWDGSSVDPDLPNIEDWLDKMKYIYETTQDRYKTIIKTYEEHKNELVNDMETNSINKFNNTPQDAGDFTGNGFTSTVNTSNTKVQVNDNISKINKLYTLLRNTYNNWVEEFRPLFGIL